MAICLSDGGYMNTIEINVTALKTEERCDLVSLLFKCGYRVAPKKVKVGQKTAHYIVADKEVQE